MMPKEERLTVIQARRLTDEQADRLTACRLAVSQSGCLAVCKTGLLLGFSPRKTMLKNTIGV